MNVEEIQYKFGLDQIKAELFISVHKKHMSNMSTANQNKYAFENIKALKWDSAAQTVNVYYGDNWWHYTKNGTWY